MLRLFEGSVHAPGDVNIWPQYLSKQGINKGRHHRTLRQHEQRAHRE